MKKLFSLILALCMLCMAASALAYTAGDYTATGAGLNGPIEVTVTFEADKIADIKIGAHAETPGISDPAFAKVPAAIIAGQTLNVDVVAGATFTSKGILEAVEAAVVLAGGDVEALKVSGAAEAVKAEDEVLTYDVVVIGGGTTGVCAAVAAARGGAKVAVIDSNGFLGGNACNGMAWYGFHSLDFTQVVAGVPSEIIQRLREIGGAGEFCPDPVAGSMVRVNSTLLKLTLTKMCIENKIDIYLHCMLTNVVKCKAFEQDVIIQSKLNSIMMSSRVLIDCTDSGDAAVAAGAVWHRGRCADGKMQVASTTLFIRGVDMEEMLDYFDEHPDQLRPIPVPDEELRRLTKRMREATVFGMGAFPDIIAKAKREGLTDYPRDRLVGQAFPKINELLLVASRVEDADPTDIDAYTKAELTALLQTEATVKLLYNHPSVVYYTIFNEGWGQFDADENYRRLKALDPSRIWDATSGWFVEKESDVTSDHVYFKKLDLKNDPDRPMVLSEFGGYSCKIEGHSFNLDKTYGYSFFKDTESFGKALKDLYMNEVIPMIDRGLCATVYTQVSDVEDETNGLVTYDRQVVKVNKDDMLEISKAIEDKFYSQF